MSDPFQKHLLQWYLKNRRDLPWRRTKDPYKIWVSEIMLQQTTVEAVIPYYERFLNAFPSVESLAASNEEQVLSLWSGLGYYSRARNLRKAAMEICEGFGGKLPDTPEELQKLPGIGRYTAGAIASIAFEKRAPIVDGNVVRVLSRLFRIKDDPKSSQGQKVFWKKSEEVLPKKNIGDFNQALMELGATVCLPENPLCFRCPIRSQCEAKIEGSPESYPQIAQKTTYRDVCLSAAVIQKEGKILLVQRPAKGLLKGFWEIPMSESGVDSLVQEWSLEILRELPLVRHAVLNRRLKIAPFLCHPKKNIRPQTHVQWASPADMASYPMSSMVTKVLKCL